MNGLELKNFIRATLKALRTVAQEYIAFDAVIDFIMAASSTGIPSWTDALTFNTYGTGSGAFCTYPDVNSKLRFWKTKVDGNIDHEPPTDPDLTEDAFWIEVSPSDGSAIKEWTPGIYGVGLQIVYYDVTGSGNQPSLYLLASTTRPYTSENLLDEIAAGDWIQIGSYKYVPVVTTGVTINVDINNQSKCAFKGSASIGAAKTWNFLNTNNLRECFIRLQLTTADIQTINGVLCNDGSWDSGAHQWTPYAPGKYDFELLSDGSEIRLKIFGPFL